MTCRYEVRGVKYCVTRLDKHASPVSSITLFATSELVAMIFRRASEARVRTTSDAPVRNWLRGTIYHSSGRDHVYGVARNREVMDLGPSGGRANGTDEHNRQQGARTGPPYAWQTAGRLIWSCKSWCKSSQASPSSRGSNQVGTIFSSC